MKLLHRAEGATTRVGEARPGQVDVLRPTRAEGLLPVPSWVCHHRHLYRKSLTRGLIIALACACGPEIVHSGSESGSGTSTTSGGESSTSTASPTGATTVDIDTTDTLTSESSSDEATGPDTPLGCYEFNNRTDDACCAHLPEPCPEVEHACADPYTCDRKPLGGEVINIEAAQCMLSTLAQLEPAGFRQHSTYGLGGTDLHTIEGAAGDIVRVRVNYQDWNVGVQTEVCQLASTEFLLACASETNPLVLSACLRNAVEDCTEVVDPACPT